MFTRGRPAACRCTVFSLTVFSLTSYIQYVGVHEIPQIVRLSRSFGHNLANFCFAAARSLPCTSRRIVIAIVTVIVVHVFVRASFGFLVRGTPAQAPVRERAWVGDVHSALVPIPMFRDDSRHHFPVPSRSLLRGSATRPASAQPRLGQVHAQRVPHARARALPAVAADQPRGFGYRLGRVFVPRLADGHLGIRGRPDAVAEEEVLARRHPIGPTRKPAAHAAPPAAASSPAL